VSEPVSSFRPGAEPSAAPPRPADGRDARARGFAAAVAAYSAWGLFPAYFKALRGVPALEVLAHRVVWSMAFLALLVSARGRWGDFAGAFRGRRLLPYVASTALISTNWLVFIWAVDAGRVLESSLGYFIAPLVNVLLGVVFLRERLGPVQRAAVAIAALGVAALVARLGAFPWVSLALALSFGLYGLVRKQARIDAVVGLLVETALLAPVALAFLGARAAAGAGAFGSTPRLTLLLAAAGVLTALPLIWFAMGVRTLRLSTMGLLQYIAPSGQLLLAVALYRERFTDAHALAFACIWTSLALCTWDAFRRPAQARGDVAALD
jgi:chloramphenicol-sensitive protein RarD